MRLVSKEKLEMAKLLVEKNGADLVEDSVLKNLKLGRLEDIEEELGIDLITLFKALTNDVYLYHNKKLIKCEQAPCLLCFDNEYCLEFQFDYDVEQVYLKDYGKTWALTNEELTDGK